MYHAIDVHGFDVVTKMRGIPDESPLGPYWLKTKFGQLENEYNFSSGPLAGCAGVPAVARHEVDKHLVLVLQPFGVPLTKYMDQLPSSQGEEEFLMNIADKLVAILSEIQLSRRVMHRDVQPGNIIITKDGPIFIDFGMAILIDDEFQPINALSRVGTEAYSSNFSERRPSTPEDDFKSLAFSLHACRVGFEKWELHVVERGRPKFDQLLEDPVVRRIMELVPTRPPPRCNIKVNRITAKSLLVVLFALLYFNQPIFSLFKSLSS